MVDGACAISAADSRYRFPAQAFAVVQESIEFTVENDSSALTPGQAVYFGLNDQHGLRVADGASSASFLEFHIPAAYSTAGPVARRGLNVPVDSPESLLGHRDARRCWLRRGMRHKVASWNAGLVGPVFALWAALGALQPYRRPPSQLGAAHAR
jgi:hypothetical protein